MTARHCERPQGAKQSIAKAWIAFSLSLLAMTLWVSPAHAQKYNPGTLGYLYADCAHALEKSATPKEFLNTYCGGFVEGYGMGVLVSNSIQLGEPDEKDPCHDEKKAEYDRINARLCGNLPDYRDQKTSPGIIIQTVAETVFRWQETLKKNKQMSIFKKPVAAEINSIITPGKFCEKLAVHSVNQNPGFVINPGLLKANWYDFVKSVPVTLEQKYDQCKKDLKEKSFSETRCGAEIEGFLAGIYSTAHLQKREKSAGACAKQIDRLYQSLDMPGKMCVTKDTKPEAVANAFLKRIDAMRAQKQSLKTSGFGGAGYQSVYYGFLCAK